MKLSHLEDLDQLHLYDSTTQGQWIIEIPDRDLYEIGIWLLNYLGPNLYQTNHIRTTLRDICNQYNRHKSWSHKQKFYLGYGIINLWNERQLEQDPRYVL